MKKYIRSIIACSLAITTLFAVGCKEDEASSSSPDSSVETPVIEESAYDLVKDGESAYTIVYDADATSAILDMAVNELSLFFEEATGVLLPAVPDTEVSYSAEGKYISVGTTTLLQEAGVLYDALALTPTGYKIQTVGQSAFLVGGGVYGTLNAVYGFLTAQFGFDCFAPDEILLDTNVSNEKLLSFDLVDIPDITWRIQGAGETFTDTSYARRLRTNQQSDFIMYFGDAFCHNFFEVVPESVRNANNWASNTGSQLCLTRDVDGLATYVVEKMKTTFLANPDSYAMSFTQEDDSGWCSCETCVACKQKYGTDSAAYILFMNECARRLQVWQEEEGIDRELYIYMFAYQSTTDAPVHYNEDTKQWEANAPELKLEKNLLVQYAPIYAAGYHSYDKPINKTYNDIMQKWLALTESGVMFWSYNYYYKGMNWHPYYDFHDLREMYQYMKKNNVMYLFEEDRVSSAKWQDWSRLKAYVRSKLAWDSDADLNKLYDDFFTHYYKDAAVPMRKLFDEYSTYYTYIIQRDGIRGQGGVSEVEEASYWPKAMLDRWIGYIEDAYDEIEYMKNNNPEEYQTLFDRICLDSIAYRSLSEIYYDSSVYIGDGSSLEQDRDRLGLNGVDT